MDEFFLKAHDLCNIGSTSKEKIWLQRLADHVRKNVLSDSSSHSHHDISLSVLDCLANLIAKAANKAKITITNKLNDDDDYENDDHSDGDNKEGVLGERDHQVVIRDDGNENSKSFVTCINLHSIADLTKNKEISAGQLALAEDKECLPSSFEESQGYRQLLPIIPSFLLGYLRWCPVNVKLQQNPTCGTLFLQDNSGFLPIEISKPDQSCLDQLVIIPSWTYVPAPDNFFKSCPSVTSFAVNGYIEVRECLPVLVQVDSSNGGSLQVPSLSLSELKLHQSHKKKMNLHGIVTAVSPVHSMFERSKPFFFVQLTCTQSFICTTIVIQGSHLMHLFHFLQVDCEYIFTNLRETTMNKKTKNERKILASTRTTKLLNYFALDQTTTNVRKRKTPLKGMVEIPPDLCAKRSEDIARQTKVSSARSSDQIYSKIIPSRTDQPKILSYQGVITRCFSEPQFGCYELDGKLRLYTVHQPCPYMGRGLRIGAEVSLFNVHPVKKGKELLGLCCCTLSSVRIIKFSTMVSDWKPSVFTNSPYALHGQDLSLEDYVQFTHACEKLLEKFSKLERTSTLIGYSSRRHISLQDKPPKLSIIQRILQQCNLKGIYLQRLPRNIYQEFFDHPHTCCPTRNNTLHLPTVYTIEELKREALEKSKGLPWQSGVIDVPSGKDGDWMYQVIDSRAVCERLILLGYLTSSSTSGYIKLYDQTGKIAMLVGTALPTNDEKADESLLDWKDCLIQVNKFDIVVETFQSYLIQSVSEQKRTRIYIRASFDSIEQILPKPSVFAEDEKQNDEKVYDKMVTTEYCSNKEQFTLGQVSKNEKTPSLLGKESNTEPCGPHFKNVTSGRESFTCQLLFLVRHRENLQLRKNCRIMYACAVDVNVIAFSTNPNPALEGLSQVAHISLKSKDLILRLQADAVMFHGFLQDGCFYTLTETVSCQDDSLAMRALNSSTMCVLIVTSGMCLMQARDFKEGITEKCHAVDKSREQSKESGVAKAMKAAREKFLFEADRIQSIEEVLNTNKNNVRNVSVKGSKSEVKLINFQGLIVRREMRHSDISGQLLPNEYILVPRFGILEQSLVSQMELGYGYLGNKTLFLRVQDLLSPNTVDVYVDLRTAPYLDGLLPGTVVRFRRFLRKISRNSNVYCSFGACSSLIVQTPDFTDQLSPRTSSSNLDQQKELLSAVPNRYLIDLVDGESSGRRIRTISRCRCRVMSIQRVSICWHCPMCSRVIEREECPHGCRSKDPFKLCSEARCLVEDGTSEAFAYLSDDLVTFLLSLPYQEMSRLKSLALSLGELVYQRYSYGYYEQNKSDNANLSEQYEANRLLSESCIAQQVRRSVILYCKPVGNINNRTDHFGQEYDTRPIMINQTEHSTFVLPKLYVKAINMTEVDYQQEIKRMFEKSK